MRFSREVGQGAQVADRTYTRKVWSGARRKKEDRGVTKDNKGDRVTKERREVKCRRQQREGEKMENTRVRHQDILADQAKTNAWSPFFYVDRPINKRVRHKSYIQLVENVPKNAG